MIFASVECSSVCLIPHPLLSLYAMGLSSGVVLDSGEGRTIVVPVVKGRVITKAVTASSLAGREVTEHLMKLLSSKGYSFSTTAEREIAREIKEGVSFVAHDFEQEMASVPAAMQLIQPYELPDGEVLTLAKERFECTEILFNAEITGREQNDSIQNLVWDAISRCGEDHEELLLANVVLAGGTTCIPGFPARLRTELQKLASPGASINVTAPPEGRYLAWLGGSLFTQAEADSIPWITREQIATNSSAAMQKLESQCAMVVTASTDKRTTGEPSGESKKDETDKRDEQTRSKEAERVYRDHQRTTGEPNEESKSHEKDKRDEQSRTTETERVYRDHQSDDDDSAVVLLVIAILIPALLLLIKWLLSNDSK